MVTGAARIDKLIQLLAEQKKLGSLEIAETLWLAMQIEPEAKGAQTVTPPQPTDERTSPDLPDNDPPVPPPPPPDREAPAPRAPVATTTPQAGVLPTAALPVWIADPAMLRDPLAVMRALKPLLRQVETGPGRRLDEKATVDEIARTQLWLPVLEAESEPWFDIVLIIDGSSSMHLWQRLVGDLGRIFRRYGAFRDLQVFDLVVDGTTAQADAVTLKSHPRPPDHRSGHRPSELIEQSGRRIAILLSDCTAPYWWDGTLLPMLQDWAKVMPTVVWQMLPEWMWARTALGRGQAISLSNGTPGAANQQLMALSVDGTSLSEREKKRLPLPVVTSEPEDLRNWSLMLSGDRRELTPGYLLPQVGGPVPKAKTLEALASEQLTGEEKDEAGALEVAMAEIAQNRIQRFLQLSSPEARRLVMLLAAAPVITLPVMRLIRDSMLAQDAPEATSPLPVAEVFLSGLLRQVPEQILPAESEIEQAINDVVQYDFVPKARRLLLDVLPKVDTVEVFNSVSAAVEERWDRFSTEDFKAFLLNPQAQEPEALPGIRSFASVTVEILKPLGGEYEALADSLQAAANPEVTTPQQNEREDDFEIPPLRILEFLHSEVREEIPPVQLVMKEFTVATVEVEDVLQNLALDNPEGPVPLTSPFYIERPPIETDCFAEIVKPGALIRVKAARQMGKSSLMSRILEFGAQQGYRSVPIYFQEADGEVFEDLEKFLRWFCAIIAEELELEIPIESIWQSSALGNKRKCTNFFQKHLLPQIKTPLVLGLDEVDLVFQHLKIAQDFFALLRTWHERGKNQAPWHNLRMVIVHSREVYVPLDLHQSPFNVGMPVELPEFTAQQVKDLARWHGLKLSAQDMVALLTMVGGHPYLVRVALYELARGGVSLAELLRVAPTEEGPYEDHLRRHLANLNSDETLVAAVAEMIGSEVPVAIGSDEAFQLDSMGLVRRRGNTAEPLCDLYRQYFRERL